jgi:hypothetical protein
MTVKMQTYESSHNYILTCLWYFFQIKSLDVNYKISWNDESIKQSDIFHILSELRQLVEINYSYVELDYVRTIADPCGTAMQGQLMREPVQALGFNPRSKIRLTSKRTLGSHIRY